MRRRFIFWPGRTGFRGLLAARVPRSSQPPRHALAVLISVCGLAGCASPKGFLEPVAARTPGTSNVEMLVDNTRADHAGGDVFGFSRAGAGFCRYCCFDSPRQRAPNWGSSAAPPPGDPATDFVTLKASYNDRPEALATFRRLVRTTPKSRYWCLSTVSTIASRTWFSASPNTSTIQGWRLKSCRYFSLGRRRREFSPNGYDRESVEYLRDELESGLRFLAKDPEVGGITLLAHSMGKLGEARSAAPDGNPRR